MKKLIVACLTGIIGACGGPTPRSLEGPVPQSDAGLEGWDVGRIEGAVDSPLIVDVVVLDAGAVDERPQPIDGPTAACEDRVLNYEDKVLGAATATINSLTFHPNGRILAAGIEHNAIMWQIEADTVLGTRDGGAGAIASDAGRADGGACGGNWTSCPATIYALAYLPDGRLAGLFCGGQFTIFGCNNAPVFFGYFAVSSVGQLVAEAHSPIRLWDTTSGNLVRTLASGGSSELEFSPDGAILAGGIAGGSVRIWDVASGAEVTNLPLAVPGTDLRIAVSPDGRWLGALASASVQIWSLGTYASVATFAVDPLATSFAFTRDGNSVITNGSKVNVYAVNDGQLRYQLGGRAGIVAVSPDGTRLAVSGGMGVPVMLYCLH